MSSLGSAPELMFNLLQEKLCDAVGRLIRIVTPSSLWQMLRRQMKILRGGMTLVDAFKPHY